MNFRDSARTRRILIINHNYVSQLEVGSNRSHHIVQTCLAAGFEVDLIRGRQSYLGHPDGVASASSHDCISDCPNLRIYAVGKIVREISVSSKVAGYLSFVVESLSLMRRLPKPDFVFATTPPLPQVVAAFGASVWHRTPLLLEITDIWPAAIIETGQLRSRTIGFAMSILEQVSYRIADCCVVSSPMYEPYLAALGIPRSRYSAVPTGSTPSMRDTLGGKAWRRSSGLENQFVVLYCGSFNAAYGIRRLLEAGRLAAVQAPKVTWLFAGSGTDRQLVESAAMECRNVRYLGALRRDKLAPVLSAVDAGIVSLCPEHRLSHSVESSKLVEYLGTGIPVISLIDGLPGAMLRAAKAGIVAAAQTPQEIVTAVVKLASMHPEELARTGLAGQSWASVNWNRQNFSAHLNNVLMSIAAVGPVTRFDWVLRSLRAFLPSATIVVRGTATKFISTHFGFNLPPVDAFLSGWLSRSSPNAEALSLSKLPK